jgi:hypothetical protein
MLTYADACGRMQVSVSVTAHGPTQVVRVAPTLLGGEGGESLDSTPDIHKMIAPEVRLNSWRYADVC